MSRPPLEVAEVVRQHGTTLLARYGPTLSGEQHRALRAIAGCRTAALGGQITPCDHWGHEAQAYNSCRHRSCPTCHGAAHAPWLAARDHELLETPSAPVILPMPPALGPLALQHPRLLYGLRCRPVAQTLQDIARDAKHLGAELGGFAGLHPGGQQLPHHPPLHGGLPAGGIAPEGTRWVPCRPRFCLPVRVLSRRFRRLYLAGLPQASTEGHLTFAGYSWQARAESTPWPRCLATLRDQEGGVDAQEPIQAPRHVLQYLARSTPRVAIANHRLVALEDGQGPFRSKDAHRGPRLRTLTLEAVEFLRRLMRPVPPQGFPRMRHCGFLANRVRQETRAQCRTLLGHATQPCAQEAAMDREAPAVPSGEPGAPCPVCQQGRMQLVQTLYRQQVAWDLSLPMPGFDTS